MASSNRGVIWSLLTAIIVLLIGLMGLLYVSYSRDQQYESEIQDLRHKLSEKDNQIQHLQSRIRLPHPLPDTSWASQPDTAFR